jgi:hypothetical protein
VIQVEFIGIIIGVVLIVFWVQWLLNLPKNTKETWDHQKKQ